jgi:hypothetical protein
MTEQPDWITNTPSTDQIHNEGDNGGFSFSTFFTPAKLFQIGAQLIEGLIRRVVEAIVGIFIPGSSAFSQLENWATTLLPAQILDPINQVLQLLISLFNFIPGAGTIIQQFAQMFGFLKDNTDTAQSSANTANSAIAELRASIDAGSSGAKIIDTFDRAADATANGLGANWDQDYDSGAGTLGTGGSGAAHWTANGSSNRLCHARHVTALTSDVQVARFVLDAAIPAGNAPTQMSLCLRMDAAKTSWVEARIGRTSCEVGYVTGATAGIGGTYTRFGTATTIVSAAGDIFEFRAGRNDGSADYEFVLMQNNATRCTQVDSGPVSNKGASYLYSGMIVAAGWAFSVFFGAPLQSQPPDVQVFTATDNTP